ncbi:DNA-3-methyladenine glycosylase family protein [Saccharibacillus sacchari]|uniref:DNA-3-methyladenine glycosylase family protein n=1 Tax=Saccharibacillus sacchari TaxID=456493 RepID=UPI000686F434|nr:DNA-3-methyladenine glycosylase [Saccharibacillus sacchari]
MPPSDYLSLEREHSESLPLNLQVTEPFSWSECLAYLGRSDVEIMHRIEGDRVYKPVELDGIPVLLELRYAADSASLQIGFPQGNVAPETRSAAASYVREWFGLDDDLLPFYALAKQDPILHPVVSAHAGLRLIGIPELFEALVWSITGQQISLGFAYTMKKRLVETYGEPLADADLNTTFSTNKPFFLFPKSARIAALSPDDLKPLQFSGRKAEYIIGIAQLFEQGKLDKKMLLNMEIAEARETLLAIRGIGAWTADYVGLKCLRHSTAFPVGDAGLQQALKRGLQLDRKPLLSEMTEASASWHGWEAYATFYLWHSLLAPKRQSSIST